MYKAKNHKNMIVIDGYEISGDEKKLVAEDKNEQLILIVDDSEMIVQSCQRCCAMNFGSWRQRMVGNVSTCWNSMEQVFR